MNAKIPNYFSLRGIEPDKTQPSDLSEVERLIRGFEAHEEEEGRFVRRYKEIAENSRNPLIRFLLRWIISDEEKHHAVTRAMVSTLKGDLIWKEPEESLHGIVEAGSERNALLKLTEEFIRLEKGGIREYKKLTKASRGYYRGLFALLVNSMMHDSEKHIEILNFLRRQLKEA